MNIQRIIYTLLILLSINASCLAQENNIMDQFSDQFEVQDTAHDYHLHTDHSNELKSVSSILFLFYKEFISSQDMNSCVFTPSCSVYAMEAIRKHGFFTGAMAALDRITRCNGMAYGYYAIDEETNLNIDPVD